jgi:hypothetical protein
MSLARRVGKLEQKVPQVLAVRAVPVPPPLPLNQPADVLEVLAEQVNAVRSDLGADPLERARTLAMLAGISLRAMELRDLAARLEAGERVLKLRREQEREASKQNRR